MPDAPKNPNSSKNGDVVSPSDSARAPAGIAERSIERHTVGDSVRFHPASFLFGALLVGLASGLVVLLMRTPQPPPIVLHPPPTPAPTATALPTATPAPIVVYVSGAVDRPGLYSLPPDARVGDALAQAGGFGEDAVADSLNLAERLWDGARVHVTARTVMESPGVATVGDVDDAAPPAGVSGALLPTPTSQTALNRGGRVNLNSATQSELEDLPGIGPTRARAIIENRPYTRVDELTRVPGIADGILAQLRDLVTVE